MEPDRETEAIKDKSGSLEKVICRHSGVHSMEYGGSALKQKLI
jgi:hypothetical protein